MSCASSWQERLTAKVGGIEEKVNGIEERVERVEHKLEGIDDKLDQILKVMTGGAAGSGLDGVRKLRSHKEKKETKEKEEEREEKEIDGSDSYEEKLGAFTGQAGVMAPPPELGERGPCDGLGGPLCEDPFGPEVKALVDEALRAAESDRTLPFDNFSEPCPALTAEQVAACKGFDFGDKTAKLPCGPLPWPAGLPEPGYVPRERLLHGRWVTVSGGQAEHIREAVRQGLLADKGAEKARNMQLRVSQHGDTCTIDASVAVFARARRTFKSGHYFYEPLVSGGNLFGVWVLPSEDRKVGFFWDLGSGRCLRIERRVISVGPCTFMRQATEINGKVSFVLHVKVSNEAECDHGHVQSRDYTALAGCNNVCTNLGKPYPCLAKDLDYPRERDTW